MNIIFLLAPLSLLLALVALAAFWWTVREGQYDDPEGDAARILIPEADHPPPANPI
jgi:cbb3-type cytochrome oxidase maturation protein